LSFEFTSQIAAPPQAHSPAKNFGRGKRTRRRRNMLRRRRRRRRNMLKTRSMTLDPLDQLDEDKDEPGKNFECGKRRSKTLNPRGVAMVEQPPPGKNCKMPKDLAPK